MVAGFHAGPKGNLICVPGPGLPRKPSLSPAPDCHLVVLRRPFSRLKQVSRHLKTGSSNLLLTPQTKMHVTLKLVKRKTYKGLEHTICIPTSGRPAGMRGLGGHPCQRHEWGKTNAVAMSVQISGNPCSPLWLPLSPAVSTCL